MVKEHPVAYSDYQLVVAFEGLCEQICDYLGVEKGRECLKQ